MLYPDAQHRRTLGCCIPSYLTKVPTSLTSRGLARCWQVMGMTERMGGRRRQERNARILNASNVCHICGHPGADAVDHVVPLNPKPGGAQGTEDIANLRPAHHDTPCPTCGRKCNREKTNKPWAPIIRRSGSLKRS